MLVPGLKRASAAGLRSEGAGSVVVDAGVTVSVVVRLTPPKVAVIVTLVFAVTAEVLTPKVALELPAATVTLAGTETTDVFALLSVTTAPPLGAAPVNVTVPCAVVPPTTDVGLTLTADRLAVVVVDGGVTVNVVVRVMPAYVAVIVILVFAVTDDVLTPKGALEVPAATVTLAGTETTEGFELLSVTAAPPLGAAPVNVIVPCAVVPPTTVLGLTLTADKLAVVVAAAWALNRRDAENGPATPAELNARTRQKNRCAGRPVTVACDTFTV